MHCAVCPSGKALLTGQSAELLSFKRGNCDNALFVLSTKAAGALKPALAVGRYQAPCLQVGAMILTAFEMGSRVSVFTVLHIVLLVLAQEGQSLWLLLLEAGITMEASVTFEIVGV